MVRRTDLVDYYPPNPAATGPAMGSQPHARPLLGIVTDIDDDHARLWVFGLGDLPRVRVSRHPSSGMCCPVGALPPETEDDATPSTSNATAEL